MPGWWVFRPLWNWIKRTVFKNTEAGQKHVYRREYNRMRRAGNTHAVCDEVARDHSGWTGPDLVQAS